MCKHVLNAKVCIRAPCCGKWFDCPECHEEYHADHKWATASKMAFGCKTCKKCFWKDLDLFDDGDEVCPHCDTVYVMPADTQEGRAMSESIDMLSAHANQLLLDPLENHH